MPHTSQHFSGQVALFLGPVKKVSAKLIYKPARAWQETGEEIKFKASLGYREPVSQKTRQ